jgi:hypothetical protein
MERALAYHVTREEPDTGERWSILWDTRRRTGADQRNTAVEKSQSAALDRARHLLRLGFVVYEIREPSGSLLMDEAEIAKRCRPAPAVVKPPPAPTPPDQLD